MLCLAGPGVLTAPLAPAADEMAKVNEHMEVMTKAQPDGLWQVMHNILATKSQKGGFHGELFAMRAPPPFTPFCCVWSVQEEALDPRGKRLDTRQLANGAPSLTLRFALQTTRTATAWSRTQNSTLTLAISENQCGARQCPVVTRAILSAVLSLHRGSLWPAKKV